MSNDLESPTFSASLEVHGKYETMRFVLSLSPVNHELIESIGFGKLRVKDITPEAVRAYSTYVHETVHWWQHVGSTSGLLYSMSYLAQSHINIKHLRKVLADFGPKKPLLRWTDKILSQEGASAQIKLADANIAVNNALDIEFYKTYAFNPIKNIKDIIRDKYFESIGHSYYIAYVQLLAMLADEIDDDFSTVPNAPAWEANFSRLRESKCEGFYWGSPVYVPPVGLQAIYEGQARFVQLQFLDSIERNRVSCQEWRDRGYFDGIYVEAFERFLELSESNWPEYLEDSIVSLFLLVCDLAINPTRGIPLDIQCFEKFIEDVDVGMRFTKLSLAIKNLSHLKTRIQNHSREEYESVSGELVLEVGYDHPFKALEAIKDWVDDIPSLEVLMEEYQTFKYTQVNMPFRVFVSHFVAFSLDRLERPEFFCWPGKWMTGENVTDTILQTWLRHLSLFSDRPDKPGVYPREWPNREKSDVTRTFEGFYNSIAVYDLTRQWILFDGPFSSDYQWLYENYSQEKAESWAENTFKQIYGVSLKEFEIVS